METKRRAFDRIQGIRGYAILLIFASHSNFGQNVIGGNRTTWLGALGSYIFFVLSGYLLLENHHGGSIALKGYYVRKIKKFYPLHLVTMLAALPLSYGALLAAERKAWFGLLCNALLIQSWVPSADIYWSYNAVSWYLSVVVFTVLITPAVLKLWNEIESKKWIVSILLLYIVFSAVWTMQYQNFAKAHWIIYIFPLIRSFDFIAGGGIWKLCQGLECSNRKADAFFLTVILLIFAVMYHSLFVNSEWYSVCVWIIPVFLLFVSVALDTKLINCVLGNRMIKFVGDISFELFLIHQLCIRYMRPFWRSMGTVTYWVPFFVNLIIALGCAMIWKKLYQMHTETKKTQ